MTDSQTIGWDTVLAPVAGSADAAAIGTRVLDAAGRAYAATVNASYLMEFEQSGAVYLFDQAGVVDAPQADRTVAAWVVTPRDVATRDVNYQRGFPLAELADGTTRDRGHLIPHLSGGLFGPNIYPQSRALNRGWSVEGSRYRSIERYAADRPGCFFFGRLVYLDETDYPRWVEIGTVDAGAVDWARFSNRAGDAADGD